MDVGTSPPSCKMKKSRIFSAELGLCDPRRELPPFHFGSYDILENCYL